MTVYGIPFHRYFMRLEHSINSSAADVQIFDNVSFSAMQIIYHEQFMVHDSKCDTPFCELRSITLATFAIFPFPVR